MPRIIAGALLFALLAGHHSVAVAAQAPPHSPSSPRRHPGSLPLRLAHTERGAGAGAERLPRGSALSVPAATGNDDRGSSAARSNREAGGAGGIPIPPPGQTPSDTSARPARRRGHVLLVVTSSLAIVLGAFFLVVWLSRRAQPKGHGRLPADVLEVLGRTPLAARHHVQLIRLGHRLLLVSVSPDGAETLAEITAPDEVNHLLALCRQDAATSISASFRSVLQQLGNQTDAVEPSADLADVAPRG